MNVKNGLIVTEEAKDLKSVETAVKDNLYAVKYSRTSLIFFGIFTLILSAGFFLKGLNANFSSLSGDQLNILTVCVKKDNPDLLQGDLVAGDFNNVKYYIPVFVDLVRLASLPDHNYLRGLNILLFFTSLIYIWGWWLLFSVWGDKWVAAILAFLVRGIMWPPGNEVWGIAGLWTMLPRTLFLALLPWVLWGWFQKRQSKKARLVIFFASGVIANVHPISGVGFITALLLADLSWTWMESRNMRAACWRGFQGGLVALLGLSPFIWTYLGVISGMKGVNSSEFYAAVQMRINEIFFDPWLYLSKWAQPKWIVLILLPWAIWFFLVRKKSAEHKPAILALGVFALTCVATVLLPFLAEAVLNKLGYNVRFAFQLLRNGKYLLIPSIIVMSWVCVWACRQLENYTAKSRKIVVTAGCLILGLTLVSRHSTFDRVPLLGDDVSRFLWPKWGGQVEAVSDSRVASELAMDGILEWIKTNTSADATFVGPRAIRAGALRAVIHDFAGAGMLIEGNPQAFIETAKRENTLREPRYQDVVERSKLIASWGADYWVTKVYDSRLRLAHSDHGWFIYDLQPPAIAEQLSR
jgi:hypothetical protein